MKFFKSGVVAISAIAVLASSPMAFALNAQDFGEKFIAALSSGGMDISFEYATVSGDTVTLSNFSFALPGYDEIAVPADIVFTEVEELSDGGYTAKQAVVDDFKFEDDDVEISIAKVVMGDLSIPKEMFDFKSGQVPSIEQLRAAMDVYHSLIMGATTVSFEGKEVVSIASTEITSQPNDEFTDYAFEYAVTGIHSDLTKLIPDPEALGMLALFDLETLDAEVQANGSWNVATGRMNAEENSITIKNVGRLDTVFDISGYDFDLIQQILKLQPKHDTDTPVDAAEIEALNMEMMDALSDKISLASLSVNFQDAGITGKILDFLAQQQGAPKEVLAAGFAAAVPAMAAQAGLSGDVQSQLLMALTTFLTAPNSLTIAASPETPVKISEIVAVAEDPNAIIELLNVSVTAEE